MQAPSVTKLQHSFNQQSCRDRLEVLTPFFALMAFSAVGSDFTLIANSGPVTPNW